MAQPNEVESSKTFHIAMLPYIASGHIIPYLHLSNELAARGHRISFLTTKKAQTQLQHLNLHPHLITFCPLTIPHVEGLPEGFELVTDYRQHLSRLISIAVDHTRDQIQAFLKTSVLDPKNKIDVVFYDLVHWVPEITRQLGVGIKSIYYCVVCATLCAFALVPARNYNPSLNEEQFLDLPPGYPSSTVVLHPGHELRSLLILLMPRGLDGITLYRMMIDTIKQSDALCLRTCSELEGNLCDYLRAQYEKPVLLTGPILGLEDSNNNSPTLEDRWAKWLAAFEAGSVVFCAFGSQLVLEKDQFQELLLGFELTGLPFFVALKPPVGCPAIEEALPDGFEERVKGRGVVFGGWVQQTLILSHPSVGCSVSHCGFGSMWESLLSDNQIVLLPHLSDQILSTRILAKDLKVAVEVERQESGWFSKESLSKAITTVMDKDNEEGVMVKKNHAKWRKILSDPGFKSGYVDKLVQDLTELCNNGK